MKSGDLDENTMFENFKRDWDNGKLTDDDPIIKMIKSFSRGARRFGWEGWNEDIEHNVLIKIYQCNYSGDGSLEGYIRIAIRHEITTLFHREHQAKRAEMPDDVKVETDIQERLEEAEEAEKSASRVKEIIFRTPEHLMWFIEAVLNAEDYLSEQKIAKKCHVRRRQVVKTKKGLQGILEKLNSDSIKPLAKGAGLFGSYHPNPVIRSEFQSTLRINTLKAPPKLDKLNDKSFKSPELDRRGHLGINFELEKESTSGCIDGEAFWWDDLDFAASDDEIVRFYEHAEICQYHKKMVEKSDKEFINQLTLLQSAFENEDEIRLESNTNLKDLSAELKLFGSRGRNKLVKDNLIIINPIPGGIIALKNVEVHTLKCKISSEIGKKLAVLLFIDLHSIIENYGGNLIKQSIIEDEEAFTLILHISANSEQINNICKKFKLRGEVISVKVG